MYKRVFFLVIAFFMFQFLFSLPAYGITYVGAYITSDTNWTLDGSPYVVEDTIVDSDVTLSIDPGVVVKFKEDASLSVWGILDARGTEDKPVYFTDYRDDTVGGDSNGDGTATFPQPGGWCHIYMREGGSVIMDHCIVRYGGNGYKGNISKSGSGTLTVTNSVFSDSSYAGLKIIDSAGSDTISGNTFSNNNVHGIMILNSDLPDLIEDNVIKGNYNGIWINGSNPTIFKNKIIDNLIGVYCIESANPVIGGSVFNANQIYNNSQYGVQNILSTPPVTIDAQYNWWGDSSGPGYLTNPDGARDSVSDYVYYNNYLECAEPCPGQVQFAPALYTVNESDGTAVIKVSRTAGSDGAVSVEYAIGDGTAGEGTDYTGTSGTLSFAHGETGYKTFTVTVVDDAAIESDETVNLTLNFPGGGATLGPEDTAVLTILNDDVDTTAPEVISTDPTGGEAGVPVSQTITVNFSEAIKAGGGISGISLSGGDTVAEYTYGTSGSELSVYPYSLLDYDTAYTLTLPAGAVQDTTGNPLIDSYSLHFSTGAMPDTVEPFLESAEVNNNELTLTYSEQLDLASVPTAGAFGVNVKGSPVTITSVIIEKTEVCITLSTPVLAGDIVTLSYNPPGVNPLQDFSGNPAGALSSYAVINNTPDTTAPEVISTDPIGGETGVPVSQTLSVTFSEAIKPGGSIGEISLADSSQQLSISKSISDNVLIIKPTSALNYNTAYTLVVPARAVKDAAGNTPAGDCSFTFTTEEGPKPEVTGGSISVSGVLVKIFIPPGAVKDKWGNNLEQGYGFNFRTKPENMEINQY